MHAMRIVVLFLIGILLPISVLADVRPDLQDGNTGILTGGGAFPGKAGRDTILLIGPWGSGAPVNGQFETPGGSTNWNGWTHQDLTEPTGTHWQISDYRADILGAEPQSGNLAAWCGESYFPACSPEDAEGGYGNGWNEIIQWIGTVANPALGVDVSMTAYANYDVEPGYDFVHIRYRGDGGFISAMQLTGDGDNQFITADFSLSPDDYQGPGQDEVVLQVWVESDGGWSDEDCIWPTAGAIQIDDITVTLDQGSGAVSDFTDFENGWFGWEVAIPQGVGDFSKLWTRLSDIDPCGFNNSTQVAFIDDGQIVPGVGPSLCISWCYGPGGYIVNTTGGRLGPDDHLHNAIESPVIPWPSFDFQGAAYEFDVFRHELFSSSSPGIFYTWSVRSTTAIDPADIAFADWKDRNFVFMGGPDYLRSSNDVSDLLEPGLQYVQVQLAVYELGFIWGINGNDGTPAPYFDNVRLKAYPFFGPGMAVREIDLAQDNFPTIGEVDLVNLGHNSVRFDMARDISFSWGERNDPGDSIIVDIQALRAGADLVDDPVLRFHLKRNPLFDPYRTSIFGTADEGTVVGLPVYNGTVLMPGRWAFDLPDSNFLFPGDVLHYCILAADDDGFEIQSSTLPADTTGFSDFTRVLGYDPSFTVRALPSVQEDPFNPGEFSHPKVLFWNDFGNRGGRNEWHGALGNLGFVHGRDYDTYDTNGPSSGVGNGLGGRATPLILDTYESLLYSSGDLLQMTLSDGSSNGDPGDDIGLLDSWLRLGSKNLLLTGDSVVQELYFGSNHGPAFLDDWLGVTYVAYQLAPLIHNQSAPKVRTIAGNGVLPEGLTWIAYGGCPGLNSFDAVNPRLDEGAIMLAEYLDPSGGAGAYTYSAATLKEDQTTGSRVISLPYDLMSIYTDPTAGDKVPASLPTRARVLEAALAYFGIEGDPLDVSPVPGAERFVVRNYPNPFNPVTKIVYTMPKAGHLTLKVYNVKGELVKTLIDEHIGTSGQVVWEGTDEAGTPVGSGVYFYEARTAGEVQVNKMVLIK